MRDRIFSIILAAIVGAISYEFPDYWYLFMLAVPFLAFAAIKIVPPQGE